MTVSTHVTPFEKKLRSIERIRKIVAKKFGVTLEDLDSKAKPANLAVARQTTMWLIRTLTDASFPEVARAVNKLDHETARCAMRSIEARLETDPVYKELLEELTLECVEALQ